MELGNQSMEAIVSLASNGLPLCEDRVYTGTTTARGRYVSPSLLFTNLFPSAAIALRYNVLSVPSLTVYPGAEERALNFASKPILTTLALLQLE